MVNAVVQRPAAGFAHMFCGATGLKHRDDLVFAIGAGHARRIPEGDDAFGAGAGRGSIEADGAALVTTYGGGGCR